MAFRWRRRTSGPASRVWRRPATYLFDHEIQDCDEQLEILARKLIHYAADEGMTAEIIRERDTIQAHREAIAGITLRTVWMDAIGREMFAEAEAEAQEMHRRVQERIGGATTQDEIDRARARLEEIRHGRHAQ